MSEPFLGEIRLLAFNFAPRGWADCNGQLLPIAQNTALFSLLGTIYGGDGRTTFALPDLRGRAAIHTGTGPGLSPRTQGSRSGQEVVTLGVSNLPAHNHLATSTANVVAVAGNTNDAVGNFWADDAGVSSATYHTGPANATMNAGAVQTTIGNSGGGAPHDNMQPFLTLRYCIAITGLFPSRN